MKYLSKIIQKLRQGLQKAAKVVAIVIILYSVLGISCAKRGIYFTLYNLIKVNKLFIASINI